MEKPLTMENIDTASGVNNIFYDEGTNMVYLVGKVSHLFNVCIIGSVVICREKKKL